MEQAIIDLIIYTFGPVIVVLLTPTTLVEDSKKWWRVVIPVSVVSLAANLFLALIEVNQGFDILIRELVAWAILTGGSPLLIAAVSRESAKKTDIALLRAGAAILTLMILSASAPFVMLLVHCSTGDCL